ncbi:MAG TPA: hypothetical protein VIJ70_06405 [Gaiellaceae bacterium]
MALGEDLERIAAVASAHGDVTGVLAAEPAQGLRSYLVAFGDGDERRWLVLDDVGQPVVRRDDVRDAASIVAMCELAADVAGGGELEELRVKLAQVRMVEQPPGIEEVEASALELERTIGAPPRVATPAFLDEVGAATLALERQLGQMSSPFSEALRAAAATIEEFVQDVERRYVADLG